MSPKEKYIYHQIHPAKLAADICAGFGSLYPLWHHHLMLALAIMVIPPPVASYLVIRYANLEAQKRSALGRYVSEHMTHAMEAVRCAGMLVMALAAWYRSVPGIVIGAAIVLFGWLKGKVLS